MLNNWLYGGLIVINKTSSYQRNIYIFISQITKPESELTQIENLTNIISILPGADASRLGLLSIFDEPSHALSARVAAVNKLLGAIAILNMRNNDGMRFSKVWDSKLNHPKPNKKPAS